MQCFDRINLNICCFFMGRGAKALHEKKINKVTQDVGGNNAGGTKEIDNCLVVDANFRT